MGNHKIVQLKLIAKDRRIKGYCKLRKAEMIHALEATTKLVEQKSNIFDEQIPNDPTPILQPTPWRPSNFAVKSKQNINNFVTKGVQKIKDFGNWLLNYIPPKPKWLTKCSSLSKTKLKKCMKREILPSN